MSGWIKIHRDILYHEIWSDKAIFKGASVDRPYFTCESFR